MSTHPELPERDRRILGVLVQRYIDDGEPISSLWLAGRGFGVSSATLRNILRRDPERPGAFSDEEIEYYVEAQLQPGALRGAKYTES